MRFRILILLCLLFPFLAGWGHWGPQVKIGFAVDNAQGREALIKSMQEEMADNRADLLLRDAKGDPAIQGEQVKDLIAQGIQALIVLPVDAQKAAPLVRAAHQAGIKVISLEHLIPGSDLDYLIAFSPTKEGEFQAKAMLKRVPKGNYVLLGKGQGFREGQMKALQPLIDKGDIRIVASRGSKGTAQDAAKDMSAILKADGKKVDAVLTSDSETAEGAAQALAKAGLSGKVPVAGTGEDLQTCRRIIADTQTLTIYHPPQKLAEEAAYLGAKLARKAKEFDCQFTEVDNGGVKLPAVFLTPVPVDAESLGSTVIKDKVQQSEEVYKGFGKT